MGILLSLAAQLDRLPLVGRLCPKWPAMLLNQPDPIWVSTGRATSTLPLFYWSPHSVWEAWEGRAVGRVWGNPHANIERGSFVSSQKTGSVSLCAILDSISLVTNFFETILVPSWCYPMLCLCLMSCICPPEMSNSLVIHVSLLRMVSMGLWMRCLPLIAPLQLPWWRMAPSTQSGPF